MRPQKLKGSDYQKKIEKMVSQRPSPGCWCAINSFRHLSKAWEICEIDQEMAFFRCACAEEEAAAALFHALKRLRYPGSEHLNLRSHIHKFAVVPFLWAIKQQFQSIPLQDFQLMISAEGEESEEQLELSFKIPGTMKRGKPIPPLHFTMTRKNNTFSDFLDKIEKLPEIGAVKDILSYLRLGSKNRSEILYAQSDGIPTIQNKYVEEFIKSQLKNITEILTAYLLIDPYKEHQLFVKQCLKSFLRMLGKFPPDIY